MTDNFSKITPILWGVFTIFNAIQSLISPSFITIGFFGFAFGMTIGSIMNMFTWNLVEGYSSLVKRMLNDTRKRLNLLETKK